VGRGLGASRPVPLVRMAVGGSGNRLVPLTGFALRVIVGGEHALAEQGEAGSGLGRRPLPCQCGSGAIAPVWGS
jgi:hypothetical protein